MARRVTPTTAPADRGTNMTAGKLAEHYAKIKRAQRLQKSANSAVQDAFKKAKADGIDTDVIKEVIARAKQEQGELFAHDQKVRDYERMLGRAVADLDDDGPDAPSQVKAEIAALEAEQEGYDAGLHGRSATDHRFEAGTPLAQAFISGHAAAVEFLTNSGMLDPQASASGSSGTTVAQPRRRNRSGASSEEPGQVH